MDESPEQLADTAEMGMQRMKDEETIETHIEKKIKINIEEVDRDNRMFMFSFYKV